MNRSLLLLVCLMVSSVILTGRSVEADILTTTFASNGGAAGNMFDLNILDPAGVTIRQLDINSDDNAAGTVWVYTRTGSYAGHETNSSDWTLIGSYAFSSAGRDTPTVIDVDDFFLAAGVNAIYVVDNLGSINYTNGSNEGDLFTSDANIEFFEGIGRSIPSTGGGFDGFQFRPRIWNGNIHYVPGIPEPTSAILMTGFFVSVFANRRRSRTRPRHCT